MINSLVSPGTRIPPIRLQSCLFQYMARAFVPDLEPTHAINQSRIYFPVVGWRFATSACLSRSPSISAPFPRNEHIHITPSSFTPPFSGSSQLPCRHLITQPATSSSQPPWRSFPSVLTDVSLFDTFDICPLLWPKLTCLCCPCNSTTYPWPVHLQPVHGLFLTFTD